MQTNFDVSDYCERVMYYVANNGTSLWKTVICLAYDADPQGVKALKTAEKKIEKILGGSDTHTSIYGKPKVHAIGMPPKDIIEAIEADLKAENANYQPLLTSQRKLILSHLRDTSQMIQVGAGQGRATVVFERPPKATDRADLLIPIDDPEKLFNALQTTVFGAQSDLGEMRQLVADKIAENEELKARVDNLQSEVYILSSSTWG